MHRARTRRRERACVYTALLGGYEQLTEQPAAAESGLDFVCLTDDPTIESETWEIRHVQPVFSEDATRSQRMLKIRAHAVFPEYDVSLYIDNSVVLRQAPERAISDLLPAGATFAAMSHGFRASVTAEFAEVVRTGLDAPDRCAEQEQHYRLCDPESLELQPLKGGCCSVDITIRAWLPRWSCGPRTFSGTRAATSCRSGSVCARPSSSPWCTRSTISSRPTIAGP